MDYLLRDCLGVSLPADWNSDQTWGTENNKLYRYGEATNHLWECAKVKFTKFSAYQAYSPVISSVQPGMTA